MDKQNNKDNKMNLMYGFTFKDLLKSNPLTILLMYIITYIFGTLLVSFIVCKIVGDINGYTFKEAYKVIMGGITDTMENSDVRLYYTAQAYINFFGYFLLFIVVPVFSLKYLKDDFSIFKDYKKVLLIIGEAVAFACISALSESIASRIICNLGYENQTSQNEALIRNMCLYAPKALVLISTVVFAPIVEELVYRKSVIALSEKVFTDFSYRHKKLSICIHLVVSALLFSLPHMLSSANYNALVWFILLLVYFISGLLLAIIYYFTNKNIYASTVAHMANNLVAILKMF